MEKIVTPEHLQRFIEANLENLVGKTIVQTIGPDDSASSKSTIEHIEQNPEFEDTFVCITTNTTLTGLPPPTHVRHPLGELERLSRENGSAREGYALWITLRTSEILQEHSWIQGDDHLWQPSSKIHIQGRRRFKLDPPDWEGMPYVIEIYEEEAAFFQPAAK